MVKRKEQPPEEGAPAWQTTFSDLMNLLLCFFVLLFASSTMDEGKLQMIAASFEKVSFSIMPQGSISLIDGQMISGGVTQLPGIESVLDYVGKASKPTGESLDVQTAGNEGETGENTGETTTLSEEMLMEQLSEEGLKQSEAMYEEIQDLLESYNIQDMQTVDFNAQYVSLEMNGSILFDSGEADFRSEAEDYLRKIASVLEKYRDNIIEIEGHTDNVPMSSSQYESNRYLSTARATKVYEFFMAEGNLIDENIKIAGYGESRPAASNETAEGRAKNRRVVIKIYNQLNSNEGDSIQ